MNDTNRALNRTLIIAVGLLLLLLGTAVAVAAAVPSVLSVWASTSTTAGDALADAVASTPITPDGHSWLLVAGGALALVVAVLLVVFVVRQGRGHTRLLAERRDNGVVTVDADVAKSVLETGLAANPGIVSSSVSAYRVRSTPALKIAVSVRRGASPTDIRDYIDRLVTEWDSLLGQETPVLITINSGLSARFAATTALTETA
ncbi:hypothetical protein HD599_002638 [Conyzicola lurida]|uniref:Alkaline shock response membrane anchor protein AmaP n=1 Tax=Conyzicola lurida TaxID=1172621 RepID=A0A841ARX1_9MICO|nr:hypothetical protein [Conyzicola lurida]MBB5844315.1 hypothetical protein [Conyzicola lurida]